MSPILASSIPPLPLCALQSQVGTPYFMSPEIYLKQPYSTTSDIWSLGCVLYDLAAQRPPFHADRYVSMHCTHCSYSYN